MLWSALSQASTTAIRANLVITLTSQKKGAWTPAL
jgi:hypothetical protein